VLLLSLTHSSTTTTTISTTRQQGDGGTNTTTGDYVALSQVDSPNPKRHCGIIAAMSRNHVIGVNNSVPWNIPKDWEMFVSVTRNKTLVVGRNTLFEGERHNFEHLAHCRRVIVVSNTLTQKDIAQLNETSSPRSSNLPFFHLASSLEASVQLAPSVDSNPFNESIETTKTVSSAYPWENVDNWIAGGEQIYRNAVMLPQTRFVHLTEIDVKIQSEGTIAYFSDKSTWEHLYKEVIRVDHPDSDPLPFVTTIYERLTPREDK
jgi:dihydrofolate reductase